MDAKGGGRRGGRGGGQSSQYAKETNDRGRDVNHGEDQREPHVETGKHEQETHDHRTEDADEENDTDDGNRVHSVVLVLVVVGRWS